MSWSKRWGSGGLCHREGHLDVRSYFVWLTRFPSLRRYRVCHFCWVSWVWQREEKEWVNFFASTVPLLRGFGTDKLVSELVGALSPANPKGLHQGWKQASIYIIVCYSFHKSFFQTTTQISTIHNSKRKPRKRVVHILEPIYIPRALNTETCINCNNEKGGLFYSAGPHRNRC